MKKTHYSYFNNSPLSFFIHHPLTLSMSVFLLFVFMYFSFFLGRAATDVRIKHKQKECDHPSQTAHACFINPPALFCLRDTTHTASVLTAKSNWLSINTSVSNHHLFINNSAGLKTNKQFYPHTLTSCFQARENHYKILL